jgi:hypothetical protein
MNLSRNGFTVTPDMRINPANVIPQFAGAHPVGGPQPVKVDKPSPWCEAIKDETGNTTEQFKLHARNFLDCVKSRETPISDLESAHRVATMCHLANISLRLRRSLRWDAEKQTVLGDDEAVRQLTRTYRAPWDDELNRLLKSLNP